MSASPIPLDKNRRLAAAVAAILGIGIAQAGAATFNWKPDTSGNWTVPGNWVGGSAPTGLNASDVLIFGGDVGGIAGTAPNYTTTNNFGQPFQLNILQLEATDITNSTLAHTIAGSAPLFFGGTSPQLLQNGVGGFSLNLPVRVAGSLAVGGTGSGTVTLNGAVSGIADITKSGPGVLRFGTAGDQTPSANQWVGSLTINGGTVRFNNNAVAGRTALRANPVSLVAGALLTTSSELRIGTLSGADGSVKTEAPVGASSESIVIHALTNGTYGGSINIGPASGTGKADGNLVIRGGATQTFTGSIILSDGDIQVGAGAGVTLAGEAAVGSAVKGGIVMNGGTFILDNTAKNANRIRGALNEPDVTGLDTVGGGTFSLIGNGTGATLEVTSRLQLGSVNNSGTTSTPRSGALTINVTQGAPNLGVTLHFSAYTRDSTTVNQFTTVDFTAKNSSGATVDLGTSANGPRILFGMSGSFTVPKLRNLLSNTPNPVTQASAPDAGWATVNGTDFATYGANGIAAATTTAFPQSGSGSGSDTTDYLLTQSRSFGSFNAQTIKIDPSAAGQSFSIGAGGSLVSRGYLLAGANDFTIGNAQGSGTVSGNTNRYFYVNEATLNIAASIGGTGAIVKSGAGTLAFLNTTTGSNINSTNSSTVVINAGTVRAAFGGTPETTSLPNGELRFRGGVLEISGGGTFNRSVGIGAGMVNWSGFNGIDEIKEDRGSGGFSAINGDVTLNLGGASQTGFAWEDAKFINSGHALVFGSRNSNSKVDWVDHLSLTAASGTANFNAREIRVIGNDNAAILGDRLQISGNITGSLQNDLLKTGNGVLELSGTNSYLGATHVRAGTLLVNSSIQSSFLTDVYDGGTLGGRGTTGALRVQAGGFLAPGELQGTDQTSTLTVGGDLRLAGGAKLQFELATGAYDKINVTGGVFLEGAELIGSLLNGFIGTENDLFFLIINDGVDPIQGQLAHGTTFAIGQQFYEIGYTGNSEANSFTGGNDLVLRQIPEPSAALLIGSGLALFASRRRRR